MPSLGYVYSTTRKRTSSSTSSTAVSPVASSIVDEGDSSVQSGETVLIACEMNDSTILTVRSSLTPPARASSATVSSAKAR